MPRNNIPKLIQVALLVVYTLCLATVIVGHSPWVDEVRAWQIVADSNSIGQVLANSRHELHPALWYVVLYGVKLLHGGIAGMQVAHLLLACAAAAVILFCAPFPLWLRATIVFGDILFYEYGVISRNYAPGVLFLFAACAVPTKTDRGLLQAAVLLLLAMQANVFAWMIAAILGVLLVGQSAIDRRGGQPAPTLAASIASAAILGVGILSSLAQFFPPPDFASPIQRAPLSVDEFVACLARITRAFTAVPQPIVHFWNTSLVTSLIGTPLAAALGLALVGVAAFLLRDRPLALAFYVVGTVGVFLACFVMETRTARHVDHFWIVLVIAMWLACSQEPQNKGRTAFLAVLAAFQLVGMGLSVYFDTHVPFDRAGEAAQRIHLAHLENEPIFGYEDYNASAVGAYLNRPIMYPQTGRTETYVRQIKGRVNSLPPAELAAKLEAFVAAHPSGCVLILSPSRPIPTGNPRIHVIGQLGEPCITGMTYTVVQVVPAR